MTPLSWIGFLVFFFSFFFLLAVAKCIIGKNKAERNCSKMVPDGPLGWGVGSTLRLSHFPSFKVFYRITFYLRAGMPGCRFGPCSGLGFEKTSGHWVKGCLGLLTINTALLLKPASWVRACLRISAQKCKLLLGQPQASKGHCHSCPCATILMCYLNVPCPGHRREPCETDEWKLLETCFMYQRFRVILTNFRTIEGVMVSTFIKL